MVKKILFVLFVLFTIFLLGCSSPQSSGDVSDKQPAPKAPAEQPGEPVVPAEVAPGEPVVPAEEPVREDDSADVMEKEEATLDSKQQEGCYDSDATEEFPDGSNLAVQGTVYIDGKAIVSGTDFCASTTRLSEWSCSDTGRAKVKTQTCENGCSEGICN
jgi:hypothetical protein